MAITQLGNLILTNSKTVCAYCGREMTNRHKPCEGCAGHNYITKKENN